MLVGVQMLTRREFLYILLGASMLIAALVALLVSGWFALPRNEPVRVASAEDVPSSRPLRVPVETDLVVYLHRTDSEIIVWDARAPIGSGCRIAWVMINDRFEDPCSGAKWCIDGSIADRRFENARSLTRVRSEVSPSGDILIYPLSRTPGTHLPPDQVVSDPMALQEARVDCPSP